MSRTLPPRPNLTHLKYEAKELLKAHAKGDAAVCALLRQLRRFRQAADADIIAAEVKLHEAQFALALDYGFTSWSALQEHVVTLATETLRTHLDLHHVTIRGNPCWEDSFSLVLSTVCMLLDRRTSADEIAWLAGNGIAPTIRMDEDCGSWWHVQEQYRNLDVLAAAIGLQVRILPAPSHSSEPDDGPILDAWLAEHMRRPMVPSLRDAMQNREIVITDRQWDWNYHYNAWCGWGIITEVRDDGTILGACLNGRTDNPLRRVGRCYALRAGTPPHSALTMQREVLTRALHRLRGDALPFLCDHHILFGIRAVEWWAQVMRTVDGFCCTGQAQGRGWTCARDTGRAVLDGAQTLARYLPTIIDQYPTSAQPVIRQIGERYQTIADSLYPAVYGGEGQRYQDFIGNLPCQQMYAHNVIEPIGTTLGEIAVLIERALDILESVRALKGA